MVAFPHGLKSSSTDVVPVDASGSSQNVAATQARSADYELIIENTMAGLGHSTPEERSKVYAYARSVVMRHLQLEKVALDLAIAEIERRWRAQDAAENEIPKKAILFDGHGPRVEARAIATVSMGRSGRRRLARSIGVAVALPAITAMIFFGFRIGDFGFRIGDKVAYRSVASGFVERWFMNPGDKPGVTAPVAAGDVAAHRDPSGGAAPTDVALAAEPEALAPSRPSAASGGGEEGGTACDSGSSMAERNPCSPDASGRAMAAETSRSATATPWLDGLGAFGDLAPGQAPSRTLALPTVTAEHLAADVATPHAAPVHEEALMSRDVPPRAAAPAREEMSPDASPPAAAPVHEEALISEGGVPRAAVPQAPKPPVTKPVNAKVATLVASGKEAALKGDVDRAVRDFSEAIRIDPKYADSYLERGQAFFRLGETERAITDYSAALAHDPRHGAALRSRGMAHLYRSETNLALADLSKAIELGEQDPRLLAPIELFYARRSRGS
ncbi:MAG TPA: tetratricopeptide repeat protein, partial [Xanthobacteraceae bacterium]|nr:tetratricopeptide repeat protein [Xanthobacteraceae bacterium]